jgi:hypothetical protein
MAGRPGLSNTDLVYAVVRAADHPMTSDEVLERVNQRQPVTTKNPKTTIRHVLSSSTQLINVGGGRYGYLPNLIKGSLIRLPLTEKKPANHPLVYTEEVRLALWPSFFDNVKRQHRGPARARLPDGSQALLPLEILAPASWGCPMPDALHRYLVDRRAAADDSLLVRIVEAEAALCEIEWESRLKRDKSAVAARNQELADAAVALFHERRAVSMAIWELTFPLLGRGLWSSEIAPDSLETVLDQDARLTTAGLGGWYLTEAITPEIRAEMADRERLGDLLLSLTAEELAEPDDVPLPDLLAGPRRLERTMADIGALLQSGPPRSDDEANALLQDLLSGDGVPHRQPMTPLEQAQELVYDAYESDSARERVRLAKEALALSADCADAYVLLAEETARTPQEAAVLYTQGVAAGERALGEAAFEDDAGMFWGILETRPYMRARLGLAQALPSSISRRCCG